jgi:2-aminoethylphosphonate-pyruvate transaminase
VLGNGHYAERLAEMARLHGISCGYLDFGWAQPIEPLAVLEALEADPAVTHLAMVHHETSTGMLNPVRQIGAIGVRQGRQLIVDAISSLGAEDLDIDADHIDWCVGTANKCLEGLPGISFVCAPKERFEELADAPRRTMYLDLYGHFVSQVGQGSTRFTPAMQLLRALDTALDLALAEGVAARTARYAGLASQIRRGLVARGISLLLDSAHAANSITNAHLWGSLTYQELHDRLRAHGYVIYATQDKSAGSFRLANMGQLSEADIDGLFAALDEVITDHPVAPAAGWGEGENEGDR